MNQCDQCDFRYNELATSAIAGRLREGPALFRTVVSDAGPVALLQRPEPAVWSTLEYICHVRDVLLVQRDRAVLALVEDFPSFPRMYRDERVDLCRYAAQEPHEVLDQLAMAAGLCALVFDRVDEIGWSRPLVYNWPEPATFDLAWLGRHTVHEIEHHLEDVVSVLRRVAAHL